MNRRLAVAVAGAAVAIAVGSVGPAAAFAGLPSTQKGSLIVPGVSIGAVKLGVRKARLLTAWGPGGDCSPNATEGGCFYRNPSRPDLGNALFTTNNATVDTMTIQLGSKTGDQAKPNFRTPLTAFHTRSGIRLGSTVAALRKAYPKAKRTSLGSGLADYRLVGPGRNATNFRTASGRISVIAIEDSRPRG
jgi:hypothetical protein